MKLRIICTVTSYSVIDFTFLATNAIMKNGIATILEIVKLLARFNVKPFLIVVGSDAAAADNNVDDDDAVDDNDAAYDSLVSGPQPRLGCR